MGTAIENKTNNLLEKNRVIPWFEWNNKHFIVAKRNTPQELVNKIKDMIRNTNKFNRYDIVEKYEEFFYHVSLVNGIWSCTCAYFYYKGEEWNIEENKACSHVLAAKSFKGDLDG